MMMKKKKKTITCFAAHRYTGFLVFLALNMLRATLQTHHLFCSTMHTVVATLYHSAAQFAFQYGSTVKEDIAFAEDGHKSSPRHSPRRSPRGVVQTPSQQSPLSSEPQATPSSPASGARPQQELSPSLPLQPQPLPPAVTRAPGHSASSTQPDIHVTSSPNNTADSQHQQRADLNLPAQSHRRGHPALSVRTTSQSPAGAPNQELLAGLGSALRAQARLRRKAVAPETASPDERDSSIMGSLGDVSPSGQLSFDNVELKSKGIICPSIWHAQFHCIQPWFTTLHHNFDMLLVCYPCSVALLSTQFEVSSAKLYLGTHHGWWQ